jgi:hypothetical protein
MTVAINGTNGITFFDASTQATAATGFGFKNRIINGAMVIDQRNAGASVTPTTTSTYTLDRWGAYVLVNSKFSVQQNAGSVTPPVGFTNYLGITSLTALSVASTDYYALLQGVEGYNIADLAWGTANAKTVTLSFWAYSSLTGTFGGAIRNNAGTRSYPFSYAISSANTWEQKTITITGDTTGTWLTNNGLGLYLYFGLGVGSSSAGTAGAWAAGNYQSATGAVNPLATNGATFYITGVQLEKGSTATSFDYRPYGTELALCQRYLPAFNSTGATQTVGICYLSATTNANTVMPFAVQPRVAPTGITTTAASGFVVSTSASFTPSALSFNTGSLVCGTVSATVSGATTGNGGILYASASGSQILFTGCEL